MTSPPTMTTFDSGGRDGLDSIVGFVNVRRFPAGVLPSPRVFGEAIRAETLHVIRRLALENGFVNQPPNAGRTTNAMCITASCHDETGNSTAFTDNESPVRRKGRPASPNPGFLNATGLRQKPRELFLETIQHSPVR